MIALTSTKTTPALVRVGSVVKVSVQLPGAADRDVFAVSRRTDGSYVLQSARCVGTLIDGGRGTLKQGTHSLRALRFAEPCTYPADFVRACVRAVGANAELLKR